jgi:hypothetical protein
MGSFFLPMAVIIFVYVRIYIAARAATKSICSGMVAIGTTTNVSLTTVDNDAAPATLRIHRGPSRRAPRHSTTSIVNNCQSRGGTNNTERTGDYARTNSLPSTRRNSPTPLQPIDETTSFAIADDSSQLVENDSNINNKPNVNGNHLYKQSPMISTSSKSKQLVRMLANRRGTRNNAAKSTRPTKKVNHYEKRLSMEIKAAKTVAIVTGCFICCWLGFAIIYLLPAISPRKMVPDWLWSTAFWLGYVNSVLNPIIYTVFNRVIKCCYS